MKKYCVTVILLMAAVAVSLLPAPVLADGSAPSSSSTGAGKVPPNFSPSNPSGGGTTSPTGQQTTTPTNTGGGPQVKPRMPIQPIQAIKPRVPIKPRP